MVLALLLVGILLVTAGVRGTAGSLSTQFGSDMTGTDGFIVWLGALLVIGLIGYVPGFQRPSRYLLALVLVVILLANNGVFAQLVTGIAQADAAGPQPSGTSTPAPAANSNTPSGSSFLGGALGAIGAIGEIGSLF